MSNLTKLEELRNQTYQDAYDKLHTFGKCAIIRPTGFGKTGILTRFCMDTQYKKVLYLFPTHIIRDGVINMANDNLPDTVQFLPYMTVARLTDERIEQEQLTDFDCIICDECHFLGAEKIGYGMQLLVKHNPNALLLGATATPERSDVIDEIHIFFDDIMTEPYTLHDAFQDNIINKAMYCYGVYHPITTESVMPLLQSEIKTMNTEDKQMLLTNVNAEISKITNASRMDHIIQLTIHQMEQDPNMNIDTNYMRFIVYFPKFSVLNKEKEQVCGWFRSAFPTHEVHHMIVNSETSEHHENVHKLYNLPTTSKRIDLIFTCDMLTMGYHVPHLTGIVLCRKTQSGTLYSQMIGRIFNANSPYNGIIFDFVDNIHIQSTYSVLKQKPAKTIWKQAEYERILQILHDHQVNPDSLSKTYLQHIQSGLLQPNEALANVLQVCSIKELKEFVTWHTVYAKHSAKHGCNLLFDTDLYVTGWEATYRELIAKIVAEPISMRCRQAWFRWIEQGGNPNGNRAQIFAQIPPKYHPLQPYCTMKRVDINRVLDVMGVPA